eukprot:CAMPEP_0115713318 /NCGR_PEP_ID=MMETSP0272-20121206/74603_1 /TAXON_ID=71861 /ORGANISM="Scrippsiella trochoidea, Strain CCMP3099" /LENGTH=61 /DNA_ID=CAMNT_0003155311 /DNA_START=26 /DNA_END=208 /DNA_ORIENTATION=-
MRMYQHTAGIPAWVGTSKEPYSAGFKPPRVSGSSASSREEAAAGTLSDLFDMGKFARKAVE